MLFAKKSKYIEFNKVISILEDERAKHHYASSTSIEKNTQ